MKRRNAPALVILATASPNLVSCALSGHRLEGNDLAVVRELQSINTIQAQYKSEFGKYAATLGELGLPASGDKDGYLLIMTATPSAYVVRANPKVFGRSVGPFTPTRALSFVRIGRPSPRTPVACPCPSGWRNRLHAPTRFRVTIDNRYEAA
jgi:hypothetical protein